ncbi:MAG: hypothetical protein FWD57_03405 [Polyangiaceae bacterium]|nr:hypothetical protein [Polyangiaceae bacterium]
MSYNPTAGADGCAAANYGFGENPSKDHAHNLLDTRLAVRGENPIKALDRSSTKNRGQTPSKLLRERVLANSPGANHGHHVWRWKRRFSMETSGRK